MSQFKNQQEAEAAGVYVRKIQSFVKREGRLTNAQARAIEENWPTLGLDHQKERLNLSQTFGRQAPVVLEIGFGMGNSLVEMAKAAPEKDFIGIEVHKPGVGSCLAEAKENGITNLRVYDHDAVEILQDCIPDGSLARVQLYFPDPWHKKTPSQAPISTTCLCTGPKTEATDWWCISHGNRLGTLRRAHA